MAESYKMDNIQDLHFCEVINVNKLNYILANQRHFDEIFTTERNNAKIKPKEHKYQYNIFAILQKLVSNCIKIPNSEYAYIIVSYKKGSGTKVGRWYVNKSIGLQSVLNCVRHTICDDKWLDIDQVNSHPSLLKQLFDKYNLTSKVLNKLIYNREEFLQSIMDEKKISRSDAKTLIIAVINGGSCHKSKIAEDFKTKIKPSIRKRKTNFCLAK